MLCMKYFFTFWTGIPRSEVFEFLDFQHCLIILGAAAILYFSIHAVLRQEMGRIKVINRCVALLLPVLEMMRILWIYQAGETDWMKPAFVRPADFFCAAGCFYRKQVYPGICIFYVAVRRRCGNYIPKRHYGYLSDDTFSDTTEYIIPYGTDFCPAGAGIGTRVSAIPCKIFKICLDSCSLRFCRRLG